MPFLENKNIKKLISTTEENDMVSLNSNKEYVYFNKTTVKICQLNLQYRRSICW